MLMLTWYVSTDGPGIVWIDEKAASKLSEPTERVRDYNRNINPDLPGYIGNIEIFHQLHCLVSLLFYLFCWLFMKMRIIWYSDNLFLESHPEALL
jgi:hypothetical protein